MRLWLLVSAGITCDLRAQSHEPNGGPGHPVIVWVEDRPEGTSRPPAKLVYARNDTTVPVEFSALRLSKCKNINIACDSVVLQETILPPHGRRAILTMVSADLSSRPSFEVQPTWKVATQCIGVVSNPDSVGARRTARNAASSVIVLPPGDFPAEMNGATLTIDFFVNGAGNADSVHVSHVSDRGYLQRFTRSLMKYVFSPQMLGGCPVAYETQMEITLGRPLSPFRQRDPL